MTESYTLIGSQMSPYSVKLRSYLRYKRIPFAWEERSVRNSGRFKEEGVLPLVPLLLRADGTPLQDSTPIIENEFESRYPEPPIYPPEPAARFLSELLEEFADEWVNKLMFWQRWQGEQDRKSAADRLARLLFGVTWWGKLLRPVLSVAVARRMVPRLVFVGASEDNAPLLQDSWQQLVADLEAHLSSRQFLFGGMPSLADFGLYGQLVQAWSDPTAGDYLRAHASQLCNWLERMAEPAAVGDFEPLDALFPTLAPVLENTVAAHFLPWTRANAGAWQAGEDQVAVELGGRTYRQQAFKYHSVSWAALAEKFAGLEGDEQALAALRKTGCLPYFNDVGGSD